MLNSKSFLAVDFGAVNLKLAEFEPNEEGGLRLTQYGFKTLGRDGMQESTREAAMLKALQDLLAEQPFNSKYINVCAPGFHVFSKFVKLPPVDTAKVTQIIQYEAQQNVPFPLEEVVWDYQILGAAPSGELEVLLVAIKSDIVEGLFRTAETAGLKLQLVDVSPAALCNAFRYNYGDLEGCNMLLDIGAKTSTLLFFDKGNVYTRGINIGASSITQDFSKESKLSFEEAEAMKLEKGFVSLGGAYEEPEDPEAAAISKISRQVMTRLHIQVNQTIQFYRGQQGGAAPQRLFLSGGASIMGFTAQFFAEKLNLPVEYFNPFRNVQIDPALNLEELAKVAHSLGEVVGLGLRNLAHCPVELNLMPKSSIKQQQFGAKKPFLIATVYCLILILYAYGWFYQKNAVEKKQQLEKLQAALEPLRKYDPQLKRATKDLADARKEVDFYGEWLGERPYWANIMVELRRVMIDAETRGKEKFGRDTGVWIEKMSLGSASLVPPAPAGITPLAPPSPSAGRPTPRGGRSGTNAPPRGPGRGPGRDPAVVASEPSQTILLRCRGVDLTTPKGGENNDFAFMVDAALKANQLFDPANTGLVGTMSKPADYTFTFEVLLTLKHPMKP